MLSLLEYLLHILFHSFAVWKRQEVHLFLYNLSNFLLQKLMQRNSIVLVYPVAFVDRRFIRDEVIALGTTGWRAEPNLPVG